MFEDLKLEVCFIVGEVIGSLTWLSLLSPIIVFVMKPLAMGFEGVEVLG